MTEGQPPTHMSREQLDQIIEKCKADVAKNPRNFAAHHDLGVAYMELRDFDEAIRYLEAATQLDPRNPGAWYLLGIAKAEKMDLDSAIDTWKHVIKINPRHAGAHHFLGKIYALKGMLDAAGFHFRKAIDIQPEPRYPCGYSPTTAACVPTSPAPILTAVSWDRRSSRAGRPSNSVRTPRPSTTT